MHTKHGSSFEIPKIKSNDQHDQYVLRLVMSTGMLRRSKIVSIGVFYRRSFSGSCGIVGLPNVGKSTLFNALTSTMSAEASNYPFCTIEPNVAKVLRPSIG